MPRLRCAQVEVQGSGVIMALSFLLAAALLNADPMLKPGDHTPPATICLILPPFRRHWDGGLEEDILALGMRAGAGIAGGDGAGVSNLENRPN